MMLPYLVTPLIPLYGMGGHFLLIGDSTLQKFFQKTKGKTNFYSSAFYSLYFMISPILQFKDNFFIYFLSNYFVVRICIF